MTQPTSYRDTAGPTVYHGWRCISPDVALVVNVPTEHHRYADPDELRIEPHHTLPYDWTRKDG